MTLDCRDVRLIIASSCKEKQGVFIGVQKGNREDILFAITNIMYGLSKSVSNEIIGKARRIPMLRDQRYAMQ
jgi:hypothetical protein